MIPGFPTNGSPPTNTSLDVQEILLANVVQFMVAGSVSIWWDDLEKYLYPLEDARKKGENSTLIEYLQLHRRTRGRYPLPRSLLSAFAFNECCDPRDKVYGLMGLFGKDSGFVVHYERFIGQIKGENIGVVVDYTNSIYQILLDVFGLVLRLGDSMHHFFQQSRVHEMQQNMFYLVNLGFHLGLTLYQVNGWFDLCVAGIQARYDRRAPIDNEVGISERDGQESNEKRLYDCWVRKHSNIGHVKWQR